MLKTISSLLRYYCFWILFFILERFAFLLNYSYKLKDTNFVEYLNTFIYGLRMDASMAGYLAVLPFLLFILCWFVPSFRYPVRFVRIYTYILIVVCSILSVVNFSLYKEWGTKINYRALQFAFGSPAEAMASSKSSPIFLSLLSLALLIAAGLLLYKYIVHFVIVRKSGYIARSSVSFVILTLLFLAIRGGWQLSPINESMAYFSQKQILNYAAVNTEWSLIRDILKSRYNQSNPYTYYTKQEARRLTDSLHKPAGGKPESILTHARPNVVLIIMESFTGNVIQSLGAEPGIDPEFEKLISQGLLFTDIYASGGRTDKGVVAILSAFPSQGSRSIMNENTKQAHLPVISEEFHQNKYHTSFYYGGESQFFNMRSYILSHNYQKLVDKPSFDWRQMSDKWGAYDGAVYTRMVKDLGTHAQPFFSTFLTLTNHEPFQLPGAPHFPGKDTENKFRSTAWYADSCLGAFIENAKKESWYKNTLFIMVADHGHYLPRTDVEIHDPARYHIPLLFFGEVIKPEYRGRKIEKTGSQNDIAATLLHQLGMSSSRYPWSKDLLSPSSPGFAFFNWEHGLGMASNQQIVTYGTTGQQILYQKDPANKALSRHLLRLGKACMQEVYQQYIEY